MMQIDLPLRQRPRVHWVSPLPPGETDIANYTLRILPELTRLAEVILWTDTPDWDPALENICQVRQLDPDQVLPADLQTAIAPHSGESIFIHIGNSWLFHSGFLRLAHRLPAVIVLHDLAIQELCRDMVRFDNQSPDLYLSEMEKWYGEPGAEAGRKFLNDDITPYNLVATMPGFEIALGRACAVLTHTDAAFAAVKARTDLPCYQLNLPYPARAHHWPRPKRISDRLRLVQFGYIGPNRRPEQILEALAEVRHEIDFRFDILGKLWNPAYVQNRIDDLGLTDRVHLHGFVKEQVLDEMLAESHLVFNLRFPTMGEASGSQLRIWDSAAASVVSDHAWYAGLPDDTVFKVATDDDTAGLISLLHRLASDRSLGRDIGEKGRSHLLQTHRPDHYAQGIVKIASEFALHGRRSLYQRSARQVLAPGNEEVFDYSALVNKVIW